jgi:putative acetyltransferase
MELRLFSKSDQSNLKKLVSEVLEEHGFTINEVWDYDLDDPQGEYLDKGGACFVLYDGNELVGSCALKPLDRETAKLRRMYLKSEYRGKGYGGQMLRETEKFARSKRFKKLILTTHSHLSQAIAFYRRNGFKETQRDGDILHFEKNL